MIVTIAELTYFRIILYFLSFISASSPVPLGPHDLTQLEEPLPMMESCSKDAGLVNKSVETNATSGAESSELAEPDAIEPSKHVEVQNRESHKDSKI